MSVIGRLDEQVDALLINPLKKRGTREADEEAAQQPIETTPQSVPVASAKSRATSNAKRAGREGSAQDELPVWLL